MNRLTTVLLITVLQSTAAILVQRGSFFLFHERLDFSSWANLWVALVSGVVYVLGALVSPHLADKVGERRLLQSLIGLMLLVNAVMACWSSAAGVLVPGYLAMSLLNGTMWPIAESYTAAGRGPRESARAVGWFNIAWSIVVMPTVALSGPLINWWTPGFFLLPVACCALSLLLSLPLEARPIHLAHDDPQRLGATDLLRYHALMRASRWSTMGSYMFILVLAPLLPEIFQQRLGYSVVGATLLGSLIDLGRTPTFAVMLWRTGWHGRTDVLAAGIVLLPASFYLVLLGQTTPVVLTGALLFGIAAGVVYFCALYYAMVVMNASVDAGGGHEAYIGTGFTVGPLAGLVGKMLGKSLLTPLTGMAVGMLPVVVLTLLGGLYPLLRWRLVAKELHLANQRRAADEERG